MATASGTTSRSVRKGCSTRRWPPSSSRARKGFRVTDQLHAVQRRGPGRSGRVLRRGAWRSASRASPSRPATATSTRRGRTCSSAAAPASTCSARSSSAARERGRQRWSFNQSALFLDFLAGNQTYQCTPWSNPTYNIFGWQRPCYLLTDEGYAPSFHSLMEETAWERYGVGRNPRLRQLHGALRLRGHGGRRYLRSSAEGAEGGAARSAARRARWRRSCRSSTTSAAARRDGRGRESACRASRPRTVERAESRQ